MVDSPLDSAEAYGILARYYDELMAEVDYGAWCDYVLGLVKDAEIAGALPLGSNIDVGRGRILDLACGTGEFSYRLAKQGYRVTALDISSEMLSIAEAKTRRHGLVVQFARQDMRCLNLTGEYDVVLCLCDSLNYLLELSDWAATFDSVGKILKPGGYFVFDVNTAHKLATVYGNHAYAGDEGEYAYIWENTYDPESQMCYMDLTFFLPAYGPLECKQSKPSGLYEKRMESHIQRAFSQRTISQLLVDAGLELLGHYGDLTRALPTPVTERITFICRKPLLS